jgi:hypothetical protein
MWSLVIRIWFQRTNSLLLRIRYFIMRVNPCVKYRSRYCLLNSMTNVIQVTVHTRWFSVANPKPQLATSVFQTVTCVVWGISSVKEVICTSTLCCLPLFIIIPFYLLSTHQLLILSCLSALLPLLPTPTPFLLSVTETILLLKPFL